MLAVAAELTSTDLQQFIDSMPPGYTSVFRAEEIREHARIVLARANRPAHVALRSVLDDGMVVLIVVADDTPGLLAKISAALVRRGLDVQAAELYSRQRAGGGPEAVDIFCVFPKDVSGGIRPLEQGEVDELAALITDEIGRGKPASDADDRRRITSTLVGPRVFFDVRALQCGEYVLVIETRDVPGLLLTISSTLGRLDLDIVQSEVRTTGGIARDRFQIEPLEGAFDDARLTEIGRRVMSAIQLLHAQHGLDRR